MPIMNIHQLTVAFDERHDRLLLRVSTSAAEEFRFWLTRRLCARLKPALDQSLARLESTRPEVVATDPLSQQILADLKRNEVIEKADLSTPFKEQAQSFPLGEDPVLVTDVQMAPLAEGGLQVLFQDKSGPQASGRSCRLTLKTELLHGLNHLISQALTKTDWQLQFAPAPVQENPSNLDKQPRGYTH